MRKERSERQRLAQRCLQGLGARVKRAKGEDVRGQRGKGAGGRARRKGPSGLRGMLFGARQKKEQENKKTAKPRP